MTKVISLASGKGGTGKTTVALNLGLNLINFGYDVVIVDANFSSPHIGLHLGSPINPSSLNDVLRGNKHITETVYKHSSGLKIVPLNISYNEIQNTDYTKLKNAIEGLKGQCSVIILDGPSGFGMEADEVFKASDEVILVVTPDMLSVTEAIKTKYQVQKHGVKIRGVVVNRVKHDAVEMHPKNVEKMLGVKLIETIPEEESIRHAMHMKHPVSYSHQDSKASVQFKKLTAELLGQKYVEHIEEEKEEGLFSKTLKRLGIK